MQEVAWLTTGVDIFSVIQQSREALRQPSCGIGPTKMSVKERKITLKVVKMTAGAQLLPFCLICNIPWRLVLILLRLGGDTHVEAATFLLSPKRVWHPPFGSGGSRL